MFSMFLFSRDIGHGMMSGRLNCLLIAACALHLSVDGYMFHMMCNYIPLYILHTVQLYLNKLIKPRISSVLRFV